MSAIHVRARVRKNGTLSLPRQIRESLGLRTGDHVEIALEPFRLVDPSISADPLLEIIGMGKGGAVNGAEEHDKAIYRSQAQ